MNLLQKVSNKFVLCPSMYPLNGKKMLNPGASGGPIPGFCPEPAGDLKRSPDPSPTFVPLTQNPGSAPEIYHSFLQVYINVKIVEFFL
jgi:hypothetical protein